LQHNSSVHEVSDPLGHRNGCRLHVHVPSQSANSPPQDKVPAENQNFAKPADVSSDSSVQKSQTDASAACTPLYDELPPPAVTQAQAQPSREASPPRPEPQVIHTEAAPKEESVPAPAAVLQTEAPSAEEPKTQAASADVAIEADA